jgi:hypothetical protein
MHQGRFTGAVLPHQAQYLSPVQAQVHILEDSRAIKTFRNTFQAQKGTHSGNTSGIREKRITLYRTVRYKHSFS